jgi:outer membrane immunogenic protein
MVLAIGPAMPPDYPHQPMNGWLGGVLAGCDLALPNDWVAGIEADFSLADIKQTDNYNDAAITLRMDYLATLRGRLGYAWNRSLIYATGGLAVAHLNPTANQYHPGGPLNPPFQATADNIHYGYAVGGGWQWAMLDNLSFKAEYLWIGLPDRTYTPTMAPGGPTNSLRAGWRGSTGQGGLQLATQLMVEADSLGHKQTDF